MKPDFLSSNQVGIKICGIRRIEDALIALEYGADSLGFNFWRKSKRFVTREQVKEWSSTLDGKVERVGVFVNADANEVISLLEDNVIDVAQFHGDETFSYCEKIAKNHKVIRAVGVKDSDSLAELTSSEISTILLDAYCPGDYGGTGKSFEWSLGSTFIKNNPNTYVILAGGLDPNNVKEAIKSVGPSAVDVASGVENVDGFKDPELIKKFISAVRCHTI